MKAIVWMVAICVAALTAGCGGGGGGGGSPATPPALSSIKTITAFSFVGFSGAQGVINEAAVPKTIAVTLPSGTSVTALTANFTTVAPSVKIGAVVQTSGGAPTNDFTAPVTYTVTAADGSSASYVVTVTVPATVSGVTTDALMYSKTAHITVNGQNLPGGITLVAPGCHNIALASGGTSSQVVYICQPAVSGAMPISVHASDGTTLSSISPVVLVPQVTMDTTMGQMVLELYPNNAPVTVANFMQYVASGFYNNLIFHRVVPGFVVQGGGFNSSLQQATTLAPITLEMPNGLSNIRGSIAMARTSAPNSATSQFFVNLVDNSATLDTSGGGYAVFGTVVMGMSVVDQIALAPTQTINGMANVPVTPIVITSATQTQ